MIRLYYNQEIKGLGLGLLLLFVAAVLNNYVTSALLLLPAHTLWLYSLFFIMVIVLALLLKIYQQVLAIAAQP
jgi:hypothetical protein